MCKEDSELVYKGVVISVYSSRSIFSPFPILRYGESSESWLDVGTLSEADARRLALWGRSDQVEDDVVICATASRPRRGREREGRERTLDEDIAEDGEIIGTPLNARQTRSRLPPTLKR